MFSCHVISPFFKKPGVIYIIKQLIVAINHKGEECKLEILKELITTIFSLGDTNSKHRTEYETYHRDKDGFCDNMNYQIYQCKALYSRTNRKRTVKIEAFSEDDAARQLYQDGYCEPFDIKRMPFPEATDAQLNNIRTYVAKKIPDDICLYDASAIIDYSIRNDSVPHPDLIQYATEMKLKFSYYIGKKALYDLIFNLLDIEDKIAFFVFCIYRFTTEDRHANLNSSPYKSLFYEFSAENLSNEQFIKSMNRYKGSELRYFGKLTIDNIQMTGGSTDTIAYKNAIAFLKKHFDLKNIKSKKIITGKNMQTNNQTSKRSILKGVMLFFGITLLIGFAIAFGWIAGIIWLIFFRKKLGSNPKKQKYVTIAVTALSALSFIFFVYSGVTNSSPEPIIISCNVKGQELEVGQDYVINIKCSPKDAKSSNFIYNIDSTCATFGKSNADNSKAILHTTAEGKVLISVSNGKIHSNTLEFNIADANVEEPSIVDALSSDSSPENTESLETEPEPFPETINDNIRVFFETSVREDVTGNWRLARVATEKQIETYALEYYTSYFQSDDEIHAIINSTLNTTNKLTKTSPDILDVVVYDYVDKEEHDANILFSGTVLANYQINISTGEINQIPLNSDQPLEDGNNETEPPSNIDESANQAEQTEVETPEPIVDMVWIDDTGKKYHSHASCSNMSDPYQIPKSDAEAMGRDACKKCY